MRKLLFSRIRERKKKKRVKRKENKKRRRRERETNKKEREKREEKEKKKRGKGEKKEKKKEKKKKKEKRERRGGPKTQLSDLALRHYLFKGRHFAGLAAFVVALGCFFRVPERSGLDFRGFRGGLGSVLEAPKTYFSKFFRTSNRHRTNTANP